MKIVFHEKFYNSDYARDAASAQGRMEAIINFLKSYASEYDIITNEPANIKDIALTHEQEYIVSVKANLRLYEKGFTVYPGKGAELPTFRLANIGEIYPEDIKNFLAHPEGYLKLKGIKP